MSELVTIVLEFIDCKDLVNIIIDYNKLKLIPISQVLNGTGKLGSVSRYYTYCSHQMEQRGLVVPQRNKLVGLLFRSSATVPVESVENFPRDITEIYYFDISDWGDQYGFQIQLIGAVKTGFYFGYQSYERLFFTPSYHISADLFAADELHTVLTRMSLDEPFQAFQSKT